ncbi:Ring canal kelch homolog [Gryllus bimaculatus]|nr:Ring canal kelch homolog [Gryllus bimaculatus]
MASPNGEKKELCPDGSSESLDQGVSNSKTAGSDHSLSTLSTHDECFHSQQFSQLSLNKMENYFLKGQLTDVTLIAAIFGEDNSKVEVVLQDVDGDAIMALVQINCYTLVAVLNYNEDTRETLLATACLLQFNDVGTFHGKVIRNQEFLMLSRLMKLRKLLASDDLNVAFYLNLGATSIEKYDLRTNSWSNVANMSARRLQFGVAVMDEKLYVVGGRDGLKTLNTVECYDLKARTWSNLHPMSTHRHGLGANVANMSARRLQFGVAVMDEKLCVVGGRDGLKTLNTVECYDLKARTWSNLPPMSTHRHGLGVGVLEGPLYAVGGHDGWSYLNTVERWDPQARQWSFVAPMSTPRSTVGVAVLNNKYDPKTDTWTIIASMSIGRDALGVCLLGDLLFAVGGFDGQHCLKVVEAYDPQTNEWQQMAPLSTGRACACLVVIKNTHPS